MLDGADIVLKELKYARSLKTNVFDNSNDRLVCLRHSTYQHRNKSNILI